MNENPPARVAEPDSDGAAPAPTGPPAEVPAEIPAGLTHQLRFEQSKQIATVSIAAAGGVLVLLQAGLLPSGVYSGGAVGLFVLSAASALFGQDKLVEGLEAGRTRSRAAVTFALVSFALLGAGVGLVVSLVL